MRRCCSWLAARKVCHCSSVHLVVFLSFTPLPTFYSSLGSRALELHCPGSTSSRTVRSQRKTQSQRKSPLNQSRSLVNLLRKSHFVVGASRYPIHLTHHNVQHLASFESFRQVRGFYQDSMRILHESISHRTTHGSPGALWS